MTITQFVIHRQLFPAAKSARMSRLPRFCPIFVFESLNMKTSPISLSPSISIKMKIKTQNLTKTNLTLPLITNLPSKNPPLQIHINDSHHFPSSQQWLSSLFLKMKTKKTTLVSLQRNPSPPSRKKEDSDTLFRISPISSIRRLFCTQFR